MSGEAFLQGAGGSGEAPRAEGGAAPGRDRRLPARETVRIPLPPTVAPGDVTLEADFLPSRHPGAPVVVMGHGFAAERRFGLEPIARILQGAGYAVLLPDYRGFGGSGGEPRLLVDHRRHREDLDAALDFAAGLPGVDASRRILWGTSFGGGHALALGARRHDVAAVIAVVPHVDGVASGLRYPLRHLPAALWAGARDALRAARGGTPFRVPVVAPSGVAALAAPDCHGGYLSILPPGLPAQEGEGWDGRIPARILLGLLGDRPGAGAGKIRCPVLIQAAEFDTLIPLGAVRRAARRLREGTLETFPMGHFAAYHEPWRSVLMERQLRFLEGVLPH